MTLIAGLRSERGLLLIADTEVTIGNELRSTREKIYSFRDSCESRWQVVIALSGDVNYALMVCDVIKEKIISGRGTYREMVSSVRQSVTEVWANHARFEPEAPSLGLLIGLQTADEGVKFLVVRGRP